MSAQIRNLRTYELELGGGIDVRETQSLLRCLASKRGVFAAALAASDTERVRVEYDADLIGPLRLLEIVRLHGFKPRAGQARGATHDRMPNSRVAT